MNLQGGHEAVLCDSAQPYSIRFDDPNRMLVLRLPEEKVIERFDDPDDMIGRRVGVEGLGASMLSAFVQSLWRASETEAAPDSDTAFLDVVIDLLATPMASAASLPIETRRPTRRVSSASSTRICAIRT